ncbi:MAG: class II glutamine amidotransferase [Candidatus Hadarchaeales archaeon]
MCRLLGLIASKPVDIEFSLGKFVEKFSMSNPDGWGIGWYENGHPKIFKEGIRARSEKSLKLSREVMSHIIIAHVRKGSGAPPSKRNSHPFAYKNWLFAHNGVCDREYLLQLLNSEYKREIEGKTDSEVYFYWILQCIEESEDFEEGVKKAIEEVAKKSYGGLNFLLSDGERLYSFRYSKYAEDYYSLFFLKRDPSEPGLFEFTSDETKALLRSKSLKGEKAVLVCSEKLTKEKWEKIELGQMLIIEPDLSVREAQIISP